MLLVQHHGADQVSEEPCPASNGQGSLKLFMNYSLVKLRYLWDVEDAGDENGHGSSVNCRLRTVA